jgi:hypothetical protein
MMFINLISLSIFLLLLPIDKTLAETFEVVEREFFWSSSNLTKLDPVQDMESKKISPKRKSPPLKTLSYKNHFDLYGTHPSFKFLLPLTEGDSSLAQIKDGHIFFRNTGKKIPLNRSIIPSWANPVPPYLVRIPMIDRVLVVYPYYIYQDKENRYVTEMYSDRGILLSTFESLPTHVSLDNPYLLVSPERSGCCESLKWSIRFYNLRKGSFSEYSCPEGFCGDVLFTKIGDRGPFLIVQEIVGKMSEIGASMQTNFFIVENDGTLSASGKTIHAIREPNLDKRRLESLSPFAISNLISIGPLHGKESWIIHFVVGNQRKALKLVSIYPDPAPSVIYLLPKDPSLHQKKGYIKIAEKRLGDLPLLVIAEPGQYTFSSYSEEVGVDKVLKKDILSDQINMVMFQ